MVRESGSIDIADRLIDSLTERFWLLAHHPRIGRLRGDLRPGLRSFAVGSYVIIYRIDDSDVLLLYIIRGTRDLPALLGD